jgi:hypothetical protein
LMAEEIKVDPVLGASALRQTEHGPVEVAGCLEIVDREGYVKRSQSGGRLWCGHALDRNKRQHVTDAGTVSCLFRILVITRTRSVRITNFRGMVVRHSERMR